MGLGTAVALFAGAAVVVAYGGWRLSAVGDALADRLKLGEALFGAVLFGGMVSLSGIVMTASAASAGLPRLAYSNAIGGIAAQTAALGLADLAWRRANLEHAAASLPNMLSATVLIGLLAASLLVGFTPDVTLLGVHAGSLVLVGAYLVGLRTARATVADPLWKPTRTRSTVPDVPDPEERRSTRRLWLGFLGFGALVAGSGWAVERATEAVIARTQIGESLAGALLLGVVNAIPETVTSVAAVRRGALTLAVSGVLGGNTFDVLNLVVGDCFYRGGSLYHAAGADEAVLTLTAVVMTAVVLAGMLRREEKGPANIGFESVLMLLVYLGGLLLVAR